MKTIPIKATTIECKFDGTNTMITYMNGDRYNMHSFIGEYKIMNFKIIEIFTLK